MNYYSGKSANNMMKLQNYFLDILYFTVYLFFIGLLLPVSAVSFFWKSIVNGIVNIFYSKSRRFTFGPLEYYMMRNDPNYLSAPDKVFYILATISGSQLNVQEFKSNFITNVLNVTNPDGTFKYERLRQYPKEFGGYYVFEHCKNFDIDKHYNICSENINKKNLGQFLADQSGLPFYKETPPWNVTIVPNYNGENKTLIYWRIHHVLGDGLSIVKLMMTRAFVGGNLDQDLAKVTQYTRPKPKLSDLTPKALYLKTIGWPRFFAENSLSDSQAFRHGSTTTNSFVYSTNKIQLKLFKRFKQEQNRSMTIVLLASISLALQSLIQKHSKFRCSDFIKVVTILPLARNENDDSLINHFGIAGIKVPINPSSSTGRNDIDSIMDYVAEELENFKDASGSPLEVILHSLMSTLPHKALDFILPKTGGVLISNMICPSEATTLYGIPLEDIQFWIKSSKFPSISFNVLSYNGYVQIGITSCTNVIPSEEALKDLCANIETILISTLSS